MMSDSATLNVPDDVIRPIIEARISAAIVEGLGDSSRIVERIVKSALGQKVDATGRVSQLSHENQHDLIEVLASEAIHKVVRESIDAWVSKQRDKIEEQVVKGLRRKEGVFAKAMVDGFANAMSSHYSVKCVINYDRS